MQEKTNKMEWQIKGLDCAMCAAKIEKALAETSGVETSSLNFVTGKLSVMTETEQKTEFWKGLENKALALEDGIVLTPISSTHTTDELNQTSTHGDEHSHDHGADSRNSWMTPLFYRTIAAILLAALGFANVLRDPASMIFFLAAYLIAGYDVVLRAIKNIIKGQVFDENFLMSLATIGAIALGDYFEAAAVMIFYQVGEYFQDLAVDRSRRSIQALTNIKPDKAVVLRNGSPVTVHPENVLLEEIIRVVPGERIPLDGTVVSGKALVDTSAITGEPVPRMTSQGDTVYSGSIVTDSVLEIKVSSIFAESTVSRILRLVEDSAQQKASSEKFITRFARVYTPVVVLLAVLLAVIPPVLGLGEFSTWLYRALVFLVISCPCALVVSVPLAIFAGIGAEAKLGIMFKGGNYLQTLAETKTVVFDKTGTLTEGVFAVQGLEVLSPSTTQEHIMDLAVAVEAFSTHPIAKAIVAHNGERTILTTTEIKEHGGKGLEAQHEGKRILVGNRKLLQDNGISVPQSLKGYGTEVFVAEDVQLLGRIIISDKIREDMVATLRALSSLGIQKTIMLTGDRKEAALATARDLGISDVRSDLLPEDKVTEFEKILIQKKNGPVAFVGDGINDAPVLARADLGIAVGGMGSDAAIEAADAVIMADDISRLVPAVAVARKTMRIVRQNIVFALAVKIGIMGLGALGIAGMWMAIFADVGVALLAILNSLRSLRLPQQEK